jgi:alkylglycerol monooxygenase
MSPSQIIVLATPVFLALIALELAWGWKKKRSTASPTRSTASAWAC